MLFARSIFVLFILPFVEGTVYIRHTEDGSSVEFYDCIDHNDLLHCRRPSKGVSAGTKHQIMIDGAEKVPRC
jgi:hypothetical protein